MLCLQWPQPKWCFRRYYFYIPRRKLKCTCSLVLFISHGRGAVSSRTRDSSSVVNHTPEGILAQSLPRTQTSLSHAQKEQINVWCLLHDLMVGTGGSNQSCFVQARPWRSFSSCQIKPSTHNTYLTLYLLFSFFSLVGSGILWRIGFEKRKKVRGGKVDVGTQEEAQPLVVTCVQHRTVSRSDLSDVARRANLRTDKQEVEKIANKNPRNARSGCFRKPKGRRDHLSCGRLQASMANLLTYVASHTRS